MSEIVVANKFIELYVLYGIDEPEITPMIHMLKPVKATPKKKGQTKEETNT